MSDLAKRSVRPTRWQVGVIVAMLVLCAASLLLTSRRESHWHVSMDAKNWRVYGSESLEFDLSGKMLRSVKGYHVGPVVISSEHAWTQNKVSTSFATNESSILRRISSTATLTRKITLVETVEVHATGKRESEDVRPPGTNVSTQVE